MLTIQVTHGVPESSEDPESLPEKTASTETNPAPEGAQQEDLEGQ